MEYWCYFDIVPKGNAKRNVAQTHISLSFCLWIEIQPEAFEYGVYYGIAAAKIVENNDYSLLPSYIKFKEKS